MSKYVLTSLSCRSLISAAILLASFLLPAAGTAFAVAQQQQTAPDAAESDVEESQIRIESDDAGINVKIGNELFTRFHVNSYDKPILYPVYGPGQIPMTRNYPMIESEGEEPDHPHHKSIWVGHEINHVDFWTERTGKVEVTEISSGDDGFVAASKWIRKDDGEVMLTDRTEYRFGADEQTRWIDVTITFVASHGEVVFKDTKEGLFAIRVHPKLRAREAPRHGVTDVTGRITNAEGITGPECWGKPAAWVDYSGEVDRQTVGISIFDHPTNLRHPTTWHARDYGLFAANPFGLHHFTGAELGTGEYKLAAGEELTLKYRAVFHAGDCAAADIPRRYDDWVAATSPTERTQQGSRTDGQAYYDIGGFHRKVTTDSEAAQLWFDRGLAMCYAFNHEEGLRCFQKAWQADSSMAMALWGMAYAMGPNINNREVDEQVMAQAGVVLQLAVLQADGGTDVERGLINALSLRHATPVPAFDDRMPQNVSYADAMRELHAQHPDNSLVAALFAESLMMLRPWNHWTKDGRMAEETPEILAVLEAGLELWPDHPALCHLYIHAMEASPHPEKALPAANRLRDAMPGAGHLVHMPSHIDVLVGDYESVIDTNLRAIEADKIFLEREGPANFYTLYRIHNYHFVVYGAMFDGQSELAMKTSRQMVRQIPEPMLREMPDFLDAFVPIPLHVMVRYGMWQDILDEPEAADYLPVTRSMRHYARALAFAATGRVAEAEKEQVAFLQTKAEVPETSMLFNNSSADILNVAESMIAGEIEYRKGNYAVAFELLRETVRRDDALNYDEPWGWMQPARHALGALLLEQKLYEEAEAVYREDLEHRPGNAWALRGLMDCLEGLGKTDEAANVRLEFEKASSRADMQIDRSCFCKTDE